MSLPSPARSFAWSHAGSSRIARTLEEFYGIQPLKIPTSKHQQRVLLPLQHQSRALEQTFFSEVGEPASVVVPSAKSKRKPTKKPAASTKPIRKKKDATNTLSVTKIELHPSPLDSHVDMRHLGRWSLDEKILFLYAFATHGKDWKQFRQYLPTRDLQQIQSHAQKVFKQKEAGVQIEASLNANVERLHFLLDQIGCRTKQEGRSANASRSTNYPATHFLPGSKYFP